MTSAIFASYKEITPEWLQKQNVKFILSDLDATLTKHNCLHNEEEAAQFRVWYNSIEKAGVGLIVVSNNKQEHVDCFVSQYKLVGIGNCKKPSIQKIQHELFQKGLSPSHSLFIGDQLFTDWLCAKQLGVSFAYIQPISSEEPFFIRLKRKIEKQLLPLLYPKTSKRTF